MNDDDIYKKMETYYPDGIPPESEPVVSVDLAKKILVKDMMPKKKKKWSKILMFIVFVFGMVAGAFLVSENPGDFFGTTPDLNESYNQGARDAMLQMMEATRQTGVTYIIVEDELVPLQCGLMQDLNKIQEAN